MGRPLVQTKAIAKVHVFRLVNRPTHNQGSFHVSMTTKRGRVQMPKDIKTNIGSVAFVS